jgi:hypothetical protein
LSGNGLKQVGTSSPLNLNIVLEYAIINIQVNLEDLGMKHQILIGAVDIKLLGR